MQRRLLSYLLLGSLPFWLNTCTLGCQKCKDLYFTPQVKDYFLDFKKGSYWIYRNVANGDLDSVYFVSQFILPETVPAGGSICYQEYGIVYFEGLSGSLKLGYFVKSWSNNFQNAQSDAIINGDYNLGDRKEISVSGLIYKNVITINNCCLSRNCYACNEKHFRFQKLYFAPQIGLIRWEAENHPIYGNVTYELIRHKINR